VKKELRVIVDTNLWISFLIGKELSELRPLIVNHQIQLLVCPQLLEEIQLVASRDKMRKYFPMEHVRELVALIKWLAEEFVIESVHPVCPDPKDDFLFALAKAGKADFLVTGDKELLQLGTVATVQVVSASEFIKLFK
jgi:hypothetical protein